MLNRYAAQLRGRSYVESFEAAIRQTYSFRQTLAVSSGTAALKCALKAYRVGPGDEVILPAFGYIAAALAVLDVGAVPRFVPMRDPYTMDSRALPRLLSGKTKAACLIHMLGVFHAPPDVVDFFAGRDIPLIHDMAQCFGSEIPPIWAADRLHAFVFSFDFNKTITTGEGGMLAVADPDLFQTAHAYSNMGHENRPGLPKYLDPPLMPGINFRMGEMEGCLGLVQLEKFLRLRSPRQKFVTELEILLSHAGASIPRPALAAVNGDYATLEMASAEEAESARRHLVSEGVEVRTLPNGLQWNWCGNWGHLGPDVLLSSYPKADRDSDRALLERCIAVCVHFGKEESCRQILERWRRARTEGRSLNKTV
ncbi:DegT/DnrJ/EryC1/StrS family aminotransferase [bacterium]|nr:DegT/DnrJ/EryC1/StrS family aminotransferase [bacterium]